MVTTVTTGTVTNTLNASSLNLTSGENVDIEVGAYVLSGGIVEQAALLAGAGV